jgi:DNA (cytosine-5)-methyltransferase 1
MSQLTSLEICAGGGGQALGLEAAGFSHAGLVELDKHACATLRQNRPTWNVLEANLLDFNASAFRGVDLLAVECPVLLFPKQASNLGTRMSGIYFRWHFDWSTSAVLGQ